MIVSPWRTRNGCVPHGRSVIVRTRDSQASRLGPRARRAYVDRADEAPWLRAQDGDWGALITQLMGAQAAPRIARHSHQRALRSSNRHDKAALAGALTGEQR